MLPIVFLIPRVSKSKSFMTFYLIYLFNNLISNRNILFTVYIQLMTLLNEWNMFLPRLFLKIPPASTSFGLPQTNILNENKKGNCYMLPGNNLGTTVFMVGSFLFLNSHKNFLFVLLAYLNIRNFFWTKNGWKLLSIFQNSSSRK